MSQFRGTCSTLKNTHRLPRFFIVVVFCFVYVRDSFFSQDDITQNRNDLHPDSKSHRKHSSGAMFAEACSNRHLHDFTISPFFSHFRLPQTLRGKRHYSKFGIGWYRSKIVHHHACTSRMSLELWLAQLMPEDKEHQHQHAFEEGNGRRGYCACRSTCPGVRSKDGGFRGHKMKRWQHQHHAQPLRLLRLTK